MYNSIKKKFPTQVRFLFKSETRGTSASRNAGVSARELRVRYNPRVPSEWDLGIWDTPGSRTFVSP